ncbi:hypothetical protein FEM48_Zijuj11G0136900 [Ziziphus jujuba var. spinosa]|uniref:DUF4220 domain-containing protein n=1 Tax=Ziziphus jujuba var. spinosa TaxID=714518 RepID=A0A978UJ95_ZIZJJ|nr:hypothetical protein FEM48_Zijuj11G0136900 [Ziziphus jujuba var. spinosa]
MVSYSLFKFLKRIVGGFLLSSKLMESSKKMFHQIRNPNVGFKLIEYELSFMYEVLHTKVTVDKFGGFEVSLTYALLIGAMGVDTISDEHWIRNCNLLDCVRGMVENIKIMLFSSSNNDIEELKCFIFEKLTQHSRKKKLDSFFLYLGSSETDSFEYAGKVELHLATEICYHSQTEMELNNYTEERKRARRMCKMISDCLFYHLMMKPEMLVPILKGNWQLASQDTFEETKEHLMNHQISDHIKACNEFMNVEGKLKLKESSGSKSVLLKAHNQGQEIKTKWEETSDRWFIFFCFGAVKCRPLLHAQQTNRGGELMTYDAHTSIDHPQQAEQAVGYMGYPNLHSFEPLLTDWIAAFTVGLITKVLTDPSHPHVNEGLYAFWASFLLLHLRGPDTITSFALEDNEFWLRHLFGLILQVVGAAYCIFLTLPNNNLLLPTILVFVVGSVKYAERTMALYLASLDHFEDTVLGLEDPNAKPERDGTEFDFNLPSESSNHIELLMVSYSLFKSFEGIIFGYRPSFKLVESSKKLFGQIKNPNVGFKLMEYELSFMYEVFHTKAAAVRSRIGVIFRLISFCFILGAFILFHFVVVKDYHDEFVDFEMSLTYALLIGATALDTISAVKLILFFDWILVSSNGLIKRWRKFVPEYVLKRRRWCESVFQYNMIDHCLGERWLWKYSLPDYVRIIVDKIKIMLFSSSTDNIEDLKRFIFENGENLRKPRYQAVKSPDDWMGFAELHDELRYTEQVHQVWESTGKKPSRKHLKRPGDI